MKLKDYALEQVAPWKQRYKPVCRFEYIISDHCRDDGRKRDTPTCAAFHPPSHTLYVGGSGGEIVAFDTSGVLEGLLEWQGVDETGKNGGDCVPP